MRAKTFTDAVFTVAYTTAGVASAVEAARALQTAGVSGALALATSPTGVGGVALGSVAVSQLAEAAAMAGVAVVSGCLAGRSQGILKADANKLSSIINKAATEAASKAKALASKYGGKNIVGTTFSEFKPTQEFVNIQKVEEYVNRLVKGEKLPAIEVYEVAGKGWFIEEGHHRYIASKIVNKPIEVVYKKTSGPTGMIDWTEVIWKAFIGEGDW